MTEQQITDEAIKYCFCIYFSDDNNLNEKGREKVKEWSKQDFIVGAKWMQEQIRLSCACKEPNFVNTIGCYYTIRYIDPYVRKERECTIRGDNEEHAKQRFYQLYRGSFMIGISLDNNR